MSDKLFPPSVQMRQQAHINIKTYQKMYTESITNPDDFWGQHGLRLDWIKPYSKVKNTNFTYPNISIKWYEDGILNVCANCVDRHLKDHGEKIAIIWESDEPDVHENITYRRLHQQVCKLANIYKSFGVGKGDRVVIYMPMIIEAAYAMLACARIGAIHSIVFGGFSPEALASRIKDCDASLLITADQAPRGGKIVPLKQNADAALAICGDIPILMVERTRNGAILKPKRDYNYQTLMDAASIDCPCEPMNAEDALFILYTSGSTGKPKGVVHTCGGYLVYASMTHQYTFDYHAGDIYWCTADVGWITGHSYIIYGPLANAATTLMFEGTPTYPNASRFWQICEKHKVNQFYTAPTAIRALMGLGDEPVLACDLSSLKVLGTVGEPINPQAWYWYNKTIGNGRIPIVDTWWQTETGGHMITPLPGATTTKPGSATKPFFGIQPVILDPTFGTKITTSNIEGILAIKDSWPGQMRTIYQNYPRFVETYFSAYKGYYFTGDGCKQDEDGYYWITGRVDDVLNISGHRLGTAEIESALVAHKDVAEAAVVGYPHPIKGQGIYCYVTLNAAIQPTDTLAQDLRLWVRKTIGAIAKVDFIQWASGLPKTRSGKIMRRILRKIAENEYNKLGDTSTLADPEVVTDLIANRQNR